jgi:hypothetical protein
LKGLGWELSSISMSKTLSICWLLGNLIISSDAKGNTSCPFLGTGRQEVIGTYNFLDVPPSKNCNDGFCMPPSGNESGSTFYPTPGLSTNGSTDICIDVLPPDLKASNASATALLCLELAANGACERPPYFNGDYCALTCGVCEQPVWADGTTGAYSGPKQILPNGLYNSSRFLAKTPRKSCKQYDVMAVVEAIKAWAIRDPPPPNLDLAKLIRAGFHDAADYNKWTGTGGPDGNLVMYQEAYYGQSHNLPLLVKSSLVQFKRQFGEALSWADLLQIASMTAVDLAGGPNFESFNFEPGRLDNEEVSIILLLSPLLISLLLHSLLISLLLSILFLLFLLLLLSILLSLLLLSGASIP